MDAGPTDPSISGSEAPPASGPRHRFRFHLNLRRRQRALGGEKQPRLSGMLREMAGRAAERITFADIAETFGSRAIGAMMLLFAIPNIIPLPPGSSAVFGAPLILIAAQLVIGRRTLWLPGFVARRSIRTADFKWIVDRILPRLRWVERMLLPRYQVLFSPVGTRFIGLVCLLLAVILFLPIPLANMLPGAAISILALSLLARDGIAWAVGMLGAIASVAIVAAVSGAAWLAVKSVWHWVHIHLF